MLSVGMPQEDLDGLDECVEKRLGGFAELDAGEAGSYAVGRA